MRISRATAVAVAVATTLIGLPALAQSNAGQPQTGSSNQTGATGATGQKLSPSDEAFLRNEARAANAEMAFGRLAQQNGSSQEVKQLGQRMEQDATTDLTNLHSVAQTAGIMLTNETNQHDQQAIQQLSQLKGQAFDEQFANRVHAHERIELGLLQQEAQTGANPQLKSYANDEMGEVQQLVDQSANIGVTEKQGPNSQPQNNGNQNMNNGNDGYQNPGQQNQQSPGTQPQDQNQQNQQNQNPNQNP